MAHLRESGEGLVKGWEILYLPYTRIPCSANEGRLGCPFNKGENHTTGRAAVVY
jgi:hypothetical protein